MRFYLDANDEHQAALIEIALEDSGCNYRITSITQVSNMLGKIEGSLIFDQEDTVTYKVIRFVIEPNSNPIQQGYEIAGVVNVLSDQLREMYSEPEQPEFEVQMELAGQVHQQVKERFENLKTKYARNFGADN